VSKLPRLITAIGIKFELTLQGKSVLDLCCGRGGGSKKKDFFIKALFSRLPG
jgi:ubiquinone/menaquinone biosynthesis C-methylase UbiE